MTEDGSRLAPRDIAPFFELSLAKSISRCFSPANRGTGRSAPLQSSKIVIPQLIVMAACHDSAVASCPGPGRSCNRSPRSLGRYRRPRAYSYRSSTCTRSKARAQSGPTEEARLCSRADCAFKQIAWHGVYARHCLMLQRVAGTAHERDNSRSAPHREEETPAITV